MSVIVGAASTLLDGGTALHANVQRELLESILKEANHLNRLVANLLDMTRLEAGALEPHKELQSIEEIIGVALSRMARPLDGHPLDVRIGEELPFVPMDELLMEQVLVNLLDNAAKYSPPGAPIEIRAAEAEGRLVVEIADRGPGLPAEDLTRIFEKFYRATGTARTPGAGLGLAICRGIVELHDGDLVAENRPGGGLLFRLRLPLATVEAGTPPVQVPLDA